MDFPCFKLTHIVYFALNAERDEISFMITCNILNTKMMT